MSWLTVAPFSAQRVAAALRNPCADPGHPASRHTSRNQLPNDSFLNGVPRSLTRKVRSPHGDLAIVSARIGSTGGDTKPAPPLFSLPDGISPSFPCWRPRRTPAPPARPREGGGTEDTRSRRPLRSPA